MSRIKDAALSAGIVVGAGLMAIGLPLFLLWAIIRVARYAWTGQ